MCSAVRTEPKGMANRNGGVGFMTASPEQVWSLVLDDACRSIVAHLDASGHEFIMLKGATVAGWLYGDPDERTYGDLDILISPEAEESVVRRLEAIGFHTLLDAATLHFSSPEEQPLRNGIGVIIDLHTTLQGARLPAGEVWPILAGMTVPWDWRGTPVRALAPHARAMHLALHVAQTGLADVKAVHDLQLGLQRLDGDTWHRAAELAYRLRAEEAFAAGLSLVPSGAQISTALQLPPPRGLETQLRAASASKSAILLERTLSARGWRERLMLVRSQLFPSVQWLRLYHPERMNTPLGIVRARLGRPLHVLLRLPSAVRERRRYRRHGRAGQ